MSVITDLIDENSECHRRISELEAGQSAEMFLALTGEITQLRAELAALKAQEPVAVIERKHIGFLSAPLNTIVWNSGVVPPVGTKLYAAPVVSAKQKGVRVSSEGVRFGNAWFSHEAITGFTAEQLNSGQCRITGRAYMDWVRSHLAAAPAPSTTEGQGDE